MAFEVQPLEGVVEDILDRRGVTPFKLGGDFVSSGHRVISAKLVKGGRVELGADEPRYVDSVIYKKWMKSPLRRDDVIMTSEAPLGELAYLDQPRDWVLGQRLFAIRPRKGVLSGRFLYYVLATQAVRENIIARASGTTVQGIRQAELRKVEIPVPPIDVQLEAAEILGALDDRIDNLRQTNATLEAIAQVLFKSWFVDFDPVRAKAEGREPEGMDAATAALFPSEFEDSELGPIPKGWMVAPFSVQFDFTMGQSPPGSTYNTDRVGVPFFQGCTDFGDVSPDERVYCSEPTRFARAGDLLMSVRAPVGSLNIASIDCSIGRGLCSIRHISGSTGLTYQFVKACMARIENAAGEGALFNSLSKQQLATLPVLAARDELIAALALILNPITERMIANAKQAAHVTKLRDTLLPRLISGKLRLPDAEALIEEALT